jgi:5-methylthioadenosine/S-adenosylhomocysteine deaminase
MTRLLITHVAVVTLNAAGTLLRDRSIAIEDDTIVAVGDSPIDFTPDRIINGYGQVALPGFVNAHCHSPMTYERGWAEDLPFPRWLNEKIWAAEIDFSERRVVDAG